MPAKPSSAALRSTSDGKCFSSSHCAECGASSAAREGLGAASSYGALVVGEEKSMRVGPGSGRADLSEVAPLEHPVNDATAWGRAAGSLNGCSSGRRACGGPPGTSPTSTTPCCSRRSSSPASPALIAAIIAYSRTRTRPHPDRLALRLSDPDLLGRLRRRPGSPGALLVLGGDHRAWPRDTCSRSPGSSAGGTSTRPASASTTPPMSPLAEPSIALIAATALFMAIGGLWLVFAPPMGFHQACVGAGDGPDAAAS